MRSFYTLFKKYWGGVFILLLFNTPSVFAQSGFVLSWDSEVGCLEYESDLKERIFEDISNADCLLACEGSTVNFTLQNNQNQSINTVTWESDGGEIINSDNTGAEIEWPEVYNQGNVSILIELENGNTLSGAICVNVKPNPKAEFEVLTEDNQFYCSHTDIYFENLSQGGEGTQIVSYHWDFGDGTTTSESDPVHSYDQPGTYTVELTVYDECNCSDIYKKVVKVREPSFEISCPTVTCEGAIEHYTLNTNPFGGEIDIDCNEYPWKVEGGEIVEQGDEWIDVIWNDIDESGFGYIYFNQVSCAVRCQNILAVKVPVVSTEGTIQGGKQRLCEGRQSRYSLPQWPSTDFDWKIYDANNNEHPDAIVYTNQRNEIVVDAEFLPGAGAYTLRADYTNTLLQCGGKAEYRLEVLEVLEIDEIQEEICQNEEQTFTLTNPIANTQWEITKNGNTIVSGSGSSFAHAFATPGYYSIRATAPGYCEDVTEINVVEIPSIVNAEIIGKEEVCPQSAETFYFDGETDGFEVEWSVDHGEILGGNRGESVSISFDDNNNTYEVSAQLVHPDFSNCSSDKITKTVIRFFPDAEIVNLHNNSSESPQTFCTSSSVPFSLEGYDSDVYTWRVEPPELGQVSEDTQDSQSPDILFNEIYENAQGQFIDQGTLYVEARVCGKMETIASMDFSLNEGPNLNVVEAPSEVCAEDSFNILFESDIPITIENPQNDMSITFSNGQTISGSGNTSQSGTSFGFYNITLDNVDDANGLNVSYEINVDTEGCNAGSVTGNILVKPTPIVNISRTGPNAYCFPDDAAGIISVFEANTQGAAVPNEFVWYFNGSSIPEMTSNPTLGNSPILDLDDLYQQTGDITGYYYVIVTGANGCETKSSSRSIMGNCETPPDCETNETTSLTGDWTSCHTIEFEGQFTGTPDEIVWRKMSPFTSQHTELENSNDYANSSERTYTVDAPGNYVFNFEVRYGNCTVIQTEEVVVGYQSEMNKIISCSGNNGYEVILENNSPFLEDFSDLSVTYHITDLNNPSNNINFDDENDDEAIIYNLPEGDYELGLTLQKGNYPVCTITNTINLQLPDASFTIDPTEYCAEESVTLQPNNPMPGATYKWEWQDKTFINKGAPIRPDFDETNGNDDKVVLTVTGPYGCEASEEQDNIVINKADFGGEISPSNPAICIEDSVNLDYIPSGSEQPSGYQWFLNGNEISGATGQTLTAAEPGLYTLYLTDENGCVDKALDGVSVNIAPPPSLSIKAPSQICEGEEFTISGRISPDDSEYRIYRTGTAPPVWSTGPEIDFADLPANSGQYEYILDYRDAETGCEDIQIFNLEVIPTPDINIQMAVADCDPYVIELKATVSPSMNGTFTWSDGQSGSTILVNHGGPYRVRFQPDGNSCGNTETMVVPKNPKDFMWIFPDGCLDYCPPRSSLNDSYITGPLYDFSYYAYILNGAPDQGGTGVPDPYEIIDQQGELMLLLDNGFCPVVSEPLKITTPEDQCKIPCQVDFKIDKIVANPNELFLVYDIYGAIISNYTAPSATVYLSSDMGTFIPSALNLQNGIYPFPSNQPLQFVPNGSFTGGNLMVFYTVEIHGEIICSDYVSLSFPASLQGKGITEFSITPNPAYSQTQIRYELEENRFEKGELRLYNLNGKLLGQRKIEDHQGSETFDLNRFSPGTYIIVLYHKGEILNQKFIIKK